MLKISADEMKKIDKIAQDDFFIPGLILMENAGIQAANIALNILKQNRKKEVSIFCGPGNNGGDGFVVARHLVNHNIKVKVFLLIPRSKIKGDALVNYKILTKMKAQIIGVKNAQLKSLYAVLNKSDLIIDAIFGIGLNKDIRGLFFEVINEINKSRTSVLSLDVPSGLCATTGRIFKTCINADVTVTFGLAKSGFFKKEGPKRVGKLIVADISLPLVLLKKK